MELKLEIKLGLLKKSPSLCATALNVTGLLLTLFLLTAANLSCTKKNQQADDLFTINLPREIHSADPLLIRGTAKRYVLFNTHRGLFFYNKDSEVEKFGASSCKWTTRKVYECKLASRKWSDGSPIKARHYVHTYQQIKKLKDESLLAIVNLKNMTAVGDERLHFEFDKRIKDVKHRLTSVLLTPRSEDKVFKSTEEMLFSGPYKVQSIGKSDIYLVSNEHFNGMKRPPVRGVFVDDPTAALNMFEAGKLDFLRYLESSNTSAYRKEALLAPFAKLDGLFFNSSKLSLNARKALLYSLNFKNLQKIFNSPSRPGCLPLPKSFFNEKIDCFKFDHVKALHFYKKSELMKSKLKIHIPNVDADEHKKLAVWAQAEWLKNLNLKVEVEIVESKMFYQGVEKAKYAIYRKAQSLDHLGCEDAVESLKKEPEFTSLNLDSSQTCAESFKALLSAHSWVPLGMPHYAHLPSKKFSGYYINLLGQFGLEGLHINK